MVGRGSEVFYRLDVFYEKRRQLTNYMYCRDVETYNIKVKEQETHAEKKRGGINVTHYTSQNKVTKKVQQSKEM